MCSMFDRKAKLMFLGTIHILYFQVVLPRTSPSTPDKRLPSPEPSHASRHSPQPYDEWMSDVHEYTEVEKVITSISKQKQRTITRIVTTTTKSRTNRKEYASAVKRKERMNERKKQKEEDEIVAKEWKTSFQANEERKKLGEKEYRIRTARINKRKVDQLMQAIAQSMRFEKED